MAGQVAWDGELPVAPPFKIRTLSPVDEYKIIKMVRENPNAPVVDARTRTVGSAVVFLRGVDPRRARPWDLPPVLVEQRESTFLIHQGENASRHGFVRRGDPVTMVSADAWFHALHAGGAAYFTLAFPDPQQPLSRLFDRSGIVELTSAAGYYWMHGYLFVDDHPYYALTDAEGRFVLPQVPAGYYEIVCWLPGWREARHERESESGMINRWIFEPPIEVKKRVTVRPGQAALASFVLSAKSRRLTSRWSWSGQKLSQVQPARYTSPHRCLFP